jgi:plastocyanin
VKIKQCILTILGIFSFSASAITVDVNVVDHKNRLLSDIVVYLTPVGETILPKTNKTIEIGQRNKSFTPYISVIQAGNKVRFHNKDDITHHIYSPVGDNKFAFKIRSGQEHTKDDFNRPGEISMGCNIHDWMSGHLLILETPYFDKTDTQGIVSIDVEMEGDYQLTLWHPQLADEDTNISQKLTIQNNHKVEVKLSRAMKKIPEQKSDDDFDFLSDY